MRTYAMGLLALLALSAPMAWLLLRPVSAPEMAYRTMLALERRDAHALYSLGSPAERRRAGITPAGVRAYLHKTLYRDGRPGRLRIVKVNYMRPNYVQFIVATERSRPDGQPRAFLLTVQQAEGEPFRVALGELLWNLIAVAYPRTSPRQAARVYRSLSEETGIHGWYTLAGGWVVYPAPGGSTGRLAAVSSR